MNFHSHIYRRALVSCCDLDKELKIKQKLHIFFTKELVSFEGRRWDREDAVDHHCANVTQRGGQSGAEQVKAQGSCCYITMKLTEICSHSRRQQRPQGGGGDGGKNRPQLIQQQSPQHQRDQTQQQSPNQQQPNLTELGDNRNSSAGRPPRQYQGGHGPRQGGPPHHGHSQNRRWHHNQKGQGHVQTNATGDKGLPPRTSKDKGTENVKPGDEQIRPPPDFGSKSPSESPLSESTPTTNAFPDLTVNMESPPGSEKAGEGHSEQPKISLLQSSRERLRRRLKDKVLKSCLLPVSAY